MSDEKVEVHPATTDRWDDVATLLGAGNTKQHCWCTYFRMSSGDYSRSSDEEREQLLRDLTGRRPTPGLVAYAGGEPVGWIGLGPRADLERLHRSRTIPKIDDRPVWSVVCFLVRPGHRRRGIAHTLLAAAVDHARAEGACGLEGYPADPDGGRLDNTFAYFGTVGLFESVGFRRVRPTGSRTSGRTRWVVRLDLDSD
ncbi:GNAT family N-acetyltransferase [Polymorphospora rubra]|uniref:N-acetyltransferase n=1 Tax=Polymorphospora rubra TaxID=338584 RepID=A0A810N5B4_9ACTN|nr:GNAT family N-acetyltransferase [Polymorphospora rubra]BCJ68702.1 N-acetyltransferase [Polymorphospora rubra]